MEWCCFCFKRKDPFRQRRQAPICRAIPLDIVMRGMAQGTLMYKVRSPDHWYKRRYKVDLQNMRLTYTPSSKQFCRKRDPMIDLYDVEEIRKGWNTDVFNKVQAKLRRQSRSAFHPRMSVMLIEENCFSVVEQHGRVVDLIAPNEHTRDAWIRGLNHLIATCKSTQIKQAHNRWLKDQVRKADINNNGSLNFNECLILLRQLNISMDRKDVRRLFDSANYRKSQIDGEDALDPEEFVRFYDGLTKRPELEDLMKKYSVSRTPILSPDELHNFLRDEQKILTAIEDCEILIEKYEPEGQKIEGYFSLKGFETMLRSVEFNIFNMKHRLIYQDMTHPLSHYYIATSHNTYLMQGQLIGESSVEGYIQALLRGCRCLELDTWDGPDDEPIVFHGYTLTSRILLRDILDSIKQYAFKASQYPVILSIENHCSLPYQEKMAEHFVNILGDYLYRYPVGPDETDFPSPEALARKILIKGKKIKETADELEEEDEVQFLEEEVEREEEMAQARIADHDPGASPPASPRSHGRLAKQLSDLVNYCSAVRFNSFEDSRNNWKFHEMASLQETNGLRIACEEGPDFVAHNKRHLTRIYPKGTRTDSSNYDPVPYWNVGCQLVALNYQTMDRYMYLHDCRFTENGRCGYILKPRFLYDREIAFDPAEQPDFKLQKLLVIQVICGQQIPKPNRATEGEVVDPYVVIKIHGHPLDEQKKKTRYIKNNGFNPLWKEKFLITLHVPELAIITFTVKDQNLTGKNELLGQFSLPFTSITEGYRHVHLEDARGIPLLPASLFVHVAIGSYTPAEPSKKKKTT